MCRKENGVEVQFVDAAKSKPPRAERLILKQVLDRVDLLGDNISKYRLEVCHWSAFRQLCHERERVRAWNPR